MTGSDPISAGMGSGPVAVVAAERGAEARARAVADQLDVAVQWDNLQTASVILYVGHDDLWLQRADVAQASPVRVDFASPRLQHRRRSGHNELLGRAVGVKAGESPRVVDATAGLGRDAYVLGDLGCEVTLVERSPVLALLLAHALERARISSVESVRAAAARMCLRQADSCSLAVPEGVVIYIDPMFSQRRGSAAAKKDLSVLQALHTATASEDKQLFDWAMTQPARRVVVKRPAKAPPLQQRQPSHAIMGKAIRFDVYAR